jgi:hypothetical protein
MRTVREIPAFELETIYRIMLRRIAKGYNADQLTFLIGAPAGSVEEIEALNKPFYTADDLEKIAMALEESNLDSLFPNAEDETILNVDLYKEQYEGKLTHTYYKIDDEGGAEKLFALREDVFPDFDEKPGSEKHLAIAKDAIKLLIRAGYFFEAKMPMEIFHSINRFLKVHLSPYYINLAILGLCADDNNEGKLRVAGTKEAYLYEEC